MNWRDVPGYEGLYQISLDVKEGACLSLNYNHTGRPSVIANIVQDDYIFWGLYKDGKQERKQAAVWIALTYPELVANDYFEGAEIDHIDTDRKNNQPSNLRWATSKENSNNELTVVHNREAHKGVFINFPSFSKVVCQFTKSGDFVAEYPSIAEAARSTGINKSAISACCWGRPHTKSAGGYVWKYKDDIGKAV